jgi:hypothetical protein
MAATENNGFAQWVQPGHLRFVPIARPIPLRVAHPPPYCCPIEFVDPSGSARDSCGDVWPDV